MFDQKGLIDNAWSSLSNRDQDVLELRDSGFTLDEIASSLGVSRERIRQIEVKARKSLVSNLTVADSELLEVIRNAFGSSPVVSCQELQGLLRVPDKARTALRQGCIALGFPVVRAMGIRLDDWHCLPSVDWEHIVETFESLAPFRDEAIGRIMPELDLPNDFPIRSLLRAPQTSIRQDCTTGWVRRARPSADSAFLWLEDRQGPAPIDLIAEMTGATSARALAEALRRDRGRFHQIRPEGSWGLVGWEHLSVEHPYANTTEAVIEVLRELGPLTSRQLVAETQRRYPVTTSRVTQCLASSLVGIEPDGRFNLRERGALPVPPTEPKRPRNIAVSGEVIATKLGVTSDVLRGSGIGVNPWMTWRTGLHYYPSSLTFEGSHSIILRRMSSGSAISSIREAAHDLGLAVGCSIVVLFNLHDQTTNTRHGCGHECPNQLSNPEG